MIKAELLPVLKTSVVIYGNRKEMFEMHEMVSMMPIRY
jgi:hypothetical protein